MRRFCRNSLSVCLLVLAFCRYGYCTPIYFPVTMELLPRVSALFAAMLPFPAVRRKDYAAVVVPEYSL